MILKIILALFIFSCHNKFSIQPKQNMIKCLEQEYYKSESKKKIEDIKKKILEVYKTEAAEKLIKVAMECGEIKRAMLAAYLSLD